MMLVSAAMMIMESLNQLPIMMIIIILGIPFNLELTFMDMSNMQKLQWRLITIQLYNIEIQPLPSGAE